MDKPGPGPLFQIGEFSLHSGQGSDFKIECDALSEDDWKCLARLVHRTVPMKYREVLGIPMGGLPLADALRPYRTPSADAILIVDDVLTTANSMEMEMYKHDSHSQSIMGAVIFARRACPDWITPLFQMHPSAERA